MDLATSAAIDVAEAAYDLEARESEWLPKLLQVGLPLMDKGHGVGGIVYARPPDGGAVATRDIHIASRLSGFERGYARLSRLLPLDVLRSLLRPCVATTLSELTEEYSGAFQTIRSQFDNGVDALGMTAIDPEGEGVLIFSGLPEVTRLRGRSRRRWQMLAAHVCAGHRLRRALARRRANGSAFPHDAEAVLDPRHFDVTDAKGAARCSSAAEALRGAAIQADRARGRLRKTDPDKALDIWKALVRGRWSMVDWLDSDGRRLVLAVPNPPGVGSPLGLSEREMQVAAYASFGHSNQFIAYQLGISEERVSMLMSSSMRKLGARTPAHLIKRLRDLRGVYLKPPRD